MNSLIDSYLIEGCGRCPLGGTPKCKVHPWHDHLSKLRLLLLETELEEELKWSVPCYTLNGKNILILSAFKNFAALSFFKGSLIEDSSGLLIKPGPNSQASRYMAFTTVEEIEKSKDIITQYIQDAIVIEKKGLKVISIPLSTSDFPDELKQKLTMDYVYRNAFESLTPGRQRGWVLYFSGAKQSKTRMARIERAFEKIQAGKGWNEYTK